MILMNSDACSPEFLSAFNAVRVGKNIRRSSWPDGQFLKVHAMTDSIAVFRNNVLTAPMWYGPRGSEQDATDWIVVEGSPALGNP